MPLQFLTFIGLSLVAAGLTATLHFSSGFIFQRYFGNLHPLIAIVFTNLLGAILLSFLLSRGWFVIRIEQTLQGLMLAASLAILLALIMILVDLKVVFPEDLNILFPQSLLFYPAIGYVVEVVFHLLPLSFLLLLLTSLFSQTDDQRIIWICILAVSLLEPIYQTVGFVGRYPLWTVVYVGLHVFLINLLQLTIFRHYDFISMYLFRLAYYLLWHIVWGHVRLRLLF